MPEFTHSARPTVGATADGAESGGAAASSVGRVLSTVVVADGDRVRVKVGGELDLETSEPLRDALHEALARSVRRIDLDLTDVTFCDCSALNVLLDLRRRALDQTKTLSIASASPAVERLLSVTGTLELFDCPGPVEHGTAEEGTAPGPARREAASPEAEKDLRIEVAQLRRAMQTRPTIDLARGILMASFSLSSDEAWTVLVTASQNTNTKLHRLAGDLVTAVKGEALPDEVREQLSSAVARVNACAGAGEDRVRG